MCWRCARASAQHAGASAVFKTQGSSTSAARLSGCCPSNAQSHALHLVERRARLVLPAGMPCRYGPFCALSAAPMCCCWCSCCGERDIRVWQRRYCPSQPGAGCCVRSPAAVACATDATRRSCILLTRAWSVAAALGCSRTAAARSWPPCQRSGPLARLRHFAWSRRCAALCPARPRRPRRRPRAVQWRRQRTPSAGHPQRPPPLAGARRRRRQRLRRLRGAQARWPPRSMLHCRRWSLPTRALERLPCRGGTASWWHALCRRTGSPLNAACDSGAPTALL